MASEITNHFRGKRGPQSVQHVKNIGGDRTGYGRQVSRGCDHADDPAGHDPPQLICANRHAEDSRGVPDAFLNGILGVKTSIIVQIDSALLAVKISRA